MCVATIYKPADGIHAPYRRIWFSN